jgi:TetR/AcrR family transcriptional repressor of nem operon
MARTRTFDEQAVIADAMTVFWRKGYEATSIDDLVQATGINRASMYGTFGSKEGLLLAALDHYVLAVNRERLKLLNGKGTVRGCLTAYFESLIAFSTGDGRGLGCLLTNTAIELSPRNARVRRKLKVIFEQVETAFRRLLERGQAAGEIGPEKDPGALAHFFLTTVQGLRVIARADPNPLSMRKTVSSAMQTLD